MPPGLLVRSLLATALSYLALVGRDAVALRYIGAKVPRPLLWIGTVAGSALGNAVGFGALTGGLFAIASTVQQASARSR